jgi:plastocyanin
LILLIGFKSFGESAFGQIPIDDMSIIKDIVKNRVEKIIINNYNLRLTIINDTQIHILTDTNEEIGTFAFVGKKQDQKNTIIITTIVANHKGNTMTFFILGTLNQFENPKLVEKVMHILNSVKWIDPDSKKLNPTQTIELETINPILNILEGASIRGNPNYEPKELVVNDKDSTIMVNNTDTMPHTVTNGKNASDEDSGKIFDTSVINGGDSYELKLEKINSGSYQYYCMIHPYMTGTLIIQ